MDMIKPVCFFLVSAYASSAPLSACGQSEISRRTESQTVMVVPIQAGTTSIRDAPDAAVGIRERGVQSVRVAAGTVVPGAEMVTSEVEIITFGYQLPDFDAADLYTHHYHFGAFYENGNGSGTTEADTNGYIEYELNLPAGQGEVQTYLYSIDAETGEAKVFADLDDLTVNRAVGILTGVSINSRANSERFNQGGAGFRPRRFMRRPTETGNQRTMQLHGEYLTLDDIQEEIFRQTRCNVEAEGDGYYLQSCL
jgi:hypothetical protein